MPPNFAYRVSIRLVQTCLVLSVPRSGHMLLSLRRYKFIVFNCCRQDSSPFICGIYRVGIIIHITLIYHIFFRRITVADLDSDISL